MADNQFKSTVDSLFKGMDHFITSKTVVGEPIEIGETIILPLIDVTFGVAAGAFTDAKKNNGGGGMGGKITPSSVLVIKGDKIRLVNIKNQDGLTKILDMIPEMVDRLSAGKNKEEQSEEKKKAAEDTLAELIADAVNDDEE